MKQTKLPEGWDQSKIQSVISTYESQSEEEAVAEDEAGVASSETVMNVPHELVSQIRELIAKRDSKR